MFSKRRVLATGLSAVVLAACGGTPDLSEGSHALASTPSVVSSATTGTTVAVTTSTVPATDPVREPVVIAFAGDTNFVGWQQGDEPLAEVGELLSGPDLMVVNLETSVADPEVGDPPVDKAYLFKSPPGSLDALVAAGVDVVSLGNNHTLDFGPDALEQTLHEIDRRGLLRVGAGSTEAEAYEPLIVEVGDWTVGLVSLSRVPCDWSAGGENTRAQVAWACGPFLDMADRSVALARSEADLVVVMVHGGIEGVMCPAEPMIELRHHFSDLGVDLMVDGHPHVVQGLASFGETMVINSTGNFAFPAARSFSANGAVFAVELSETGLELRVTPVRGPGGVVTPATDAQWDEIIGQINAYSDGWTLDASGLARRTPEVKGPCSS